MRYAKPFLIFILCTFFSVQSFAKTKTSKEKIKQALVLIKDANDDLKNKDYKYALEGYKEAYALYPTPVLLYRMALSNDKLGNDKEAISFYKQCLESGKATDKLKALSQGRIEELERVKTVNVKIETTPAGASIYAQLDGESIGETPASLDLPPGDHTLYVKLEGYRVYTLKKTLESGKDLSEKLELELLKSDDVVEKPEEIEPATEKGLMTTLGWTSIAVGGALVVGGGTFSLLSSSKENEANNYNKQSADATRAELADLRDSATSFSNISTILFVSGGVLAAGGIAMIVLDSGSEQATTINLAPLQGGASVGFSRNF